MSLSEKQVQLLYQRSGFVAPESLGVSKNHKFSAIKKEIDGHLFDSTGEANAYLLLRQWQMAGAISDLEIQPRYLIQECHYHVVNPRTKAGHSKAKNVFYVPDFRFQRNGKTVVVDFKGCKTAVYRIKAKMFQETYPEIEFQEWDRQTLRNGGQRCAE